MAYEIININYEVSFKVAFNFKGIGQRNILYIVYVLYPFYFLM